MVHDALHQLKLDDIDIVFIENVGNLVCPASFDLGQHRNVTLLSVPEGDDKPSKYPVMFRAADMVALTKVDLLPVLDDFSAGRACENVRALANAAPVLELSVRQSESLGAWLDWLDQQVEQHRQCCQRGETSRPRVQPDGARLHALST
jgi:hydrogenase nickel incorporation protein HypB